LTGKQTFQGQTVQEAVQKGLEALGLTGADQAEIEVTQEAKKGFLGIGAKPAIVEMSAKASPAASEPAGEESPRREEAEAGETEAETQPATEEGGGPGGRRPGDS